ncbi:FGGY family carbohydrate kinase [Cellulomonas massiliensis]|uniref:FGGY family carbohydrate kinase n=1 Tax=Cellulomonas massiliensis TaxID=1465811 RepID=UPI0002FCE70B|nr:FGGY family carbohydrate kinase [Cellulomonas massiliensis]
MGDDEVLVGLDVGSSRTKAAAYRRDGSLVASSAVPTPRDEGPDGVDFPVLDVLAAARSAVAALDLAPGSARGLGVGTMGEVGTVLRDGRLADLRFPAWYDERGSDHVRRLRERLGGERLDGWTGGHARPVSSLAKLAWLREARAVPSGVFVGVAGAFAWQLTGEPVQESGLASTSGAFDPVRGEPLTAVWEAAGLRDLAPAPVLGPCVGRPARTAIALGLGLAEGAPVVVAGHDHPVAAVGTGAVRGEVVGSVGTSEGMLAVLRRRPGSWREVAALVADGFTLETWPASGEPLLMREGLRPGLAVATFLRTAGASAEELDRLAPPPGAAPVLDRAVSLALEEGRDVVTGGGPQAWGALVDHYALSAADGERALRRATGADGVTVLTGGGLRSARLLAARARLGASVPVVSGVVETVTRGSAAVAGVAAGWWASPDGMPGAVRLPVDGLV